MGKIELPPRPLYEAVPAAVTKSMTRAVPPEAVNGVQAVNSAVNKRGAYPGTDARRVYMRAYMKKRRSR